MLIAVNFHYVRSSFDHRFPGIHGITPGQLEDQLSLLSKAGEFVSASQILSAIRWAVPLPDRAIVVTFDDGLREQYETAWPVLRRMGIPAIFFINTAPIVHTTISSVHKIHMIRAHFDPGQVMTFLQRNARSLGIAMDLHIDDAKVLSQYKYDKLETSRLKYLLNFILAPADRDRVVQACFQEVFPDSEARISRDLYMDVPQIEELAALGCIGTHAHEHLPLGVLPTDVVQEQIHLAATYLTRWTGEPPVVLSYPYGSIEACSMEAGRIARESGIEFAFTMERATNADLRQPMFLSRFSSSDLPGGNAPRCGIDQLFEVLPHGTWHRHNEDKAYTENLA